MKTQLFHISFEIMIEEVTENHKNYSINFFLHDHFSVSLPTD